MICLDAGTWVALIEIAGQGMRGRCRMGAPALRRLQRSAVCTEYRKNGENNKYKKEGFEFKAKTQ